MPDMPTHFRFQEEDLTRIARVLGATLEREGTLVRLRLQIDVPCRQLILEIQPELRLPFKSDQNRSSNLVAVYASNAFLQLHNCSGYIASEELGEVVFFAREGTKVSGLVVEREAGCSLFANVSQQLLHADFTQLPPEVVMSSVALSMTETLFEHFEEQSPPEDDA